MPCGCDAEIRFVLTPDQPHYGKDVCSKCGAWQRWVPKPDAEKAKRPAKHRDLVKKHGRGECELCGCPESDLPPGDVLEGHHVEEFQNGGEATRENVWVICTACHSLINWRRTYVGHWLKRLRERTGG